jgi:hypothetical protein
MVMTVPVQHHVMQLHTLSLGVQAGVIFALDSYAFTKYIEVIRPYYYEALSYGYVLNWKALIYIDILSCLFYKWNSTLNHCLIQIVV